MSEHKYTRRGRVIESVERWNGKPIWRRDFGSRNAAKRKSHELQMDEDGALGLGSVQCR